MNTQNVRWTGWEDARFDEARERDLPVFLFVGFVGCGSCDRMAAESFADTSIADQLNTNYVPVLVDRDERPDVDATYMSILHTSAGRGGWPLIAILDHDRRPIWIGSYLERDVLGELLDKVSEAWTSEQAALATQAANLTDRARDAVAVKPAGQVPTLDQLNPIVGKIGAAFDPEWGGFGGPPKFTMPSHLVMLTRAALNTGAEPPQQVVRTTLDAIAAGGIYDQIGGGFFRYSVDQEWLVPRFEKMTFDQAAMLGVYRDSFALWRDPLHRRVVEETADYAIDRLGLPEGGFAHAEAGDSIGPDGAMHEGIFYTWVPTEWRRIFEKATIEDAPVDVDAALEWFDITDEGHIDGRSIPNRRNHRDDQMRPPEIAAVRNALREVRKNRPAPQRNDLVVLESSAAMVSALANCSTLLRRDDWRDRAILGGEFLVDQLYGGHGWSHCWRAGADPVGIRALPADYTEMIGALMALSELTGEARWLELATTTADELLDRFFDPVDGGLWHTPEFEEQPVVRLKQIEDRQGRSPNAAAARLLVRLAAITGEARYQNHAERILELLGGALEQRGVGMPLTITAVDEFHRGVHLVVIVGPDDAPATEDPETRRMARLVLTLRRPHLAVVWGERFDSPIWEQCTAPGAYLIGGDETSGPYTTAEDLFERITGQELPDGQRVEV